MHRTFPLCLGLILSIVVLFLIVIAAAKDFASRAAEQPRAAQLQLHALAAPAAEVARLKQQVPFGDSNTPAPLAHTPSAATLSLEFDS